MSRRNGKTNRFFSGRDILPKRWKIKTPSDKADGVFLVSE
jgi:hypothetical protein